MGVKKKSSFFNDLHEKEISLFFDHCFDQGLFQEFDPEEYKRTLFLLEKFQIQKNWRIIEPGSGCGRFTRLLVKKVGADGFIHACEISPKMVEYCRKGNFPAWVRFSNVSVLDLELPEHSIDAIICFNVWPHFTRAEVYLSCFRRILKSKGILYISHSCGRDRVNSIHQNKPEDIIYSHMLPSANEMERFLSEQGWETLEKIDTDDMYFMKGVKKNP